MRSFHKCTFCLTWKDPQAAACRRVSHRLEGRSFRSAANSGLFIFRGKRLDSYISGGEGHFLLLWVDGGEFMRILGAGKTSQLKISIN